MRTSAQSSNWCDSLISRSVTGFLGVPCYCWRHRGNWGIMADVRDSLDLGDFYHIGIAVNDIDRGIERLAALGMTAGPVFELLVPSLYRGKRTEAGVEAVFAPLGV